MRKINKMMLEEYDFMPEAPAEWFLPELRSAMRRRRSPDGLGFRRLLERHDAPPHSRRGARRKAGSARPAERTQST